jgi:hypothetical protein
MRMDARPSRTAHGLIKKTLGFLGPALRVEQSRQGSL